jgi:NitT/TauT family transport system permease protein
MSLARPEVVAAGRSVRPAMTPRLTRAARLRLARWLLVVGLLVLWEILARAFASPNLISPPSRMFRALFTDVFSDEHINAAILLTLYEVTVAYAMSVAVGLVIGLAIGWTSFGRRSLFPIVLLIYSIPQVVFLPLFVLGFGIGPAAKIAFGFTHGVLPIIVNVVAGMRNVNMLYIRGARSMGATTFDIARHVYFRLIVPSFFAGMRLAMTMTLLGVILAELYVSTTGIGYFTKLFAETFDPAPLFALIGLLAVMAIVLNEIVRVAERRFTRWQA